MAIEFVNEFDKPPLPKIKERINRSNRAEYLNRMPTWFKQLMNHKEGPGRSKKVLENEY